MVPSSQPGLGKEGRGQKRHLLSTSGLTLYPGHLSGLSPVKLRDAQKSHSDPPDSQGPDFGDTLSQPNAGITDHIPLSPKSIETCSDLN